MIVSKQISLILPASLLSLVTALGIAWSQFITMSIATVVFLAVLGVCFFAHLPAVSLGLIGFLLAGYAFGSRAFAYLGFPPLYAGEIVLGLGILGAALSGCLRPAFRSKLSWLIVVFGIWGAFRTVPYWAPYGALALRDAALWGYGAFALLVAGFVMRSNLHCDVLRHYGNFLPYFIVWVPIALIISILFSSSIPYIPYSKVPILTFKAGDMGVHLTGAFAFLSLGLYRNSRQESKVSVLLNESILLIVCLIGIVAVGSFSRGALLSFLMGLSALIIARPISQSTRVLAFCLLIAVSLFAFHVDLGVPGSRRISLFQISENTKSVFGTPSEVTLEGTRNWRIKWWSRIIDYTFLGKYFWTGKGYGINLADSDGFQTDPEHTLRSPHNGHLSVLARSGVPGFALWIILQVAFGLKLIQAYMGARKLREDMWEKVFLWILVYWLAFITNATFDVFLEGPQGGIWFWCLFGFGIAAVEAQRNQMPQPKIHTNHGAYDEHQKLSLKILSTSNV